MSIGAPAPGSFGSNPIPAQLASAAGPSFQGAYSGAFPLLFSGFQATDGGLTAITPGEGATITITGSAPSGGGSPVSWEISIPSANVSDSGWGSVGIYQDLGDGPIQALSYVAMGYWKSSKYWSFVTPSDSIGVLVFGFETPTASMPASGQAIFTGNADAAVFQAGNFVQVGYVSGNASLSADFASGKISGAFTGMKGYAGAVGNPWNDVSVTGAIAAGTNRFNGVTAVTSVPTGGSGIMGSSATGSINGAFFGPAAQQIGAVWTLTDGNLSAVGGVMAGH